VQLFKLPQKSDIYCVERTGRAEDGEFKALFAQSGFALTKVVRTKSPLSVVEAIRSSRPPSDGPASNNAGFPAA